MASPTTRWARGCGCGCGLLVLALGLVGWSGYASIREIIGQAERAERLSARLRERHDGPSDFAPSASGAVPPERLRAFLQARQLMAEARRDTEASLALLSSESGQGAEQVPGLVGRLLEWGLGVARVEGMRGLIPQVIEFVAARAEALLETGMAPREYLYLYSITYYCWLGKSPADGPAFPIVSGEGDDGGGRRSGQDEFDVREQRREDVLTHLNQRLLPVLRRQLAALEEEEGASDSWRQALVAEIGAMERDRFRIPWRDGLPGPIARSLEAHRRPLEASYSPLCNPLEVLAGD